MRRAFDVDVLACPRCGGRLRLIATLDDPRVIQDILTALALPVAGADRGPPDSGLRPTDRPAALPA